MSISHFNHGFGLSKEEKKRGKSQAFHRRKKK